MDHKVVDDAEALLDVAWYEQVPGQSVSRSARDDTQCRTGMNQATCHLVHSTVTTNSHHSIHAAITGCFGQRCGITGTLRHLNIDVKQVMINVMSNKLRNNPFARRPGNGVDDEQYFLFHKGKFM